MTIAEQVHQELIRKNKKLALAESCTGGAIAARLTAIPGASLFLLGSIVAYSTRWKEQFLQVKPETLDRFGAESKEVVKEMVTGLFIQTETDYAIAVSGFAGPSGRLPGTIFMAIGERDQTIESIQMQIEGSRTEVIQTVVDEALYALLKQMSAP